MQIKKRLLTLFLSFCALFTTAYFSSNHSTHVNAETGITLSIGEDDISFNRDLNKNANYFYFYLADTNSIANGEAGDMRFKATAAQGVLTLINADLSEETHALNLCKQTDKRYYVQFDNWSGDKFTIQPGQAIRLNGTVSRTYNDITDTVIFDNITIHFTKYGYTVNELSEITIGMSNITVNNTNTYTTDKQTINTLSSALIPSVCTNNRAYPLDNGNAITIERSDSSETLTSGIYVNGPNTISFNWANPLTAGDKIKIMNGEFSILIGNSIYAITIEYYYFEYDGSKYNPINDTKTVTLTEANITSLQYSVSPNTETYLSPTTTIVMSVYVNEDNELPIDSAWDKGWLINNALTVTRANGEVISGLNIWIIKGEARKYSIFWNLSWKPAAAHNFEPLDKLHINGTITNEVTQGAFKIIRSVQLQNWDIVFTGTNFVLEDDIADTYIYNNSNTFTNAHRVEMNTTGFYFAKNEDDNVLSTNRAWTTIMYGFGKGMTLIRGGETTEGRGVIQCPHDYYISLQAWGTGLKTNIAIQNGDEYIINGGFVLKDTTTGKTSVVVMDNVHFYVKNNALMTISDKFNCNGGTMASLCINNYSLLDGSNNYTWDSISLRFGGYISKTAKEEFDSLGATAYGIEYSYTKDSKQYGGKVPTTATSYVKSFGDAEFASDGEVFQMSLLLKDISKNGDTSYLTTEITAKCYVTIGGNTFYMSSKTYSVKTIAQQYITANVPQYAQHKGIIDYLAGIGE